MPTSDGSPNTATSETGSVIQLVAGGDTAGFLRGPRSWLEDQRWRAVLESIVLSAFINIGTLYYTFCFLLIFLLKMLGQFMIRH